MSNFLFYLFFPFHLPWFLGHPFRYIFSSKPAFCSHLFQFSFSFLKMGREFALFCTIQSSLKMITYWCLVKFVKIISSLFGFHPSQHNKTTPSINFISVLKFVHNLSKNSIFPSLLPFNMFLITSLKKILNIKKYIYILSYIINNIFMHLTKLFNHNLSYDKSFLLIFWNILVHFFLCMWYSMMHEDGCILGCTQAFL